MISRDEIDGTGQALGINPTDVQRDYLFGWVLAGLFEDREFGQRLVLKGGNALRKGYFSDTRFSSDLDFTAPGQVDPERLLSALNQVCRLVQARTGVVFALDRNKISDSHAVDSTRTVHKYTLYFTDFYGKRRNVTVGLRMDVTEFGRLHLPPQDRALIHPYSDSDACASTLRVVSLEEALADKMKCLLQRRSSFDLFDLVYSILVNKDVSVDRTAVVKTFLSKTIFAPSPHAAKNLLLAVPFETLRWYWDNKIVCARRSLLDFSTAVHGFKEELGSLFSAFGDSRHGQLAFFPADKRDPIMEAGRSRTLLRLTYAGVERMVEPYSLQFKRRTSDGVGQEYLYVWDTTGGRSSGPGIKSLLNGGIARIENTEIPFAPRFEVELATAGEFGPRTTFGGTTRGTWRIPGRSTAWVNAVRRTAAQYQVRCATCGKVFRRSVASTAMRPHNNPAGWPCHGRRGYRT